MSASESLPVLAADTVVVLGTQILGKPESKADAARMLRALGGRTHEVVTGVCLVAAGAMRSAVDRTRVTFVTLTDEAIDWYVATGEPFDKAGGYHIDGSGAALIQGVEGSPSNVAGLPVQVVLRLARQSGPRPRPSVTRALALTLLLAVAPLAAADDVGFGGPFEWRDHWLVTRSRLTLPAPSAHALPPGHISVGLDLDWGNDLGWEQDRAGESPAGRSFLVDGEHRTLAFEARRGLGHGLDVGIRVPLEWRGGGILDGVIDWFHGFTRALGLPDNGRRAFGRDLLRVDLRHDGERLAWDDRSGAALGRVEVSGRWSFVSVEGAGAALIARVALPSGTGPFAGGRPALGLQIVGSRRIGSSAEATAGLGGTLDGETQVGGVDYASDAPRSFPRGRKAPGAPLEPDRPVERRRTAHRQRRSISRVSSGI